MKMVDLKEYLVELVQLKVCKYNCDVFGLGYC